MNSTKRYILKPGRHQFAPRSPAIHHNHNLNDEEAGWYLDKYPHIASLFEAITEEPEPDCRMSDKEPIPENITAESHPQIGEITSLESMESHPLIGEIQSMQSVKSPTQSEQSQII